MPYEGIGPFYLDNASADVGTAAGCCPMKSTSPTAGAFSTSDFGSSGQKWIKVKPQNVTNSTGVTPGYATSAGNGWLFNQADLDATANLPADRKVCANVSPGNGNGWGITLVVTSSALTTANVTLRAYYMIVRDSDGVVVTNIRTEDSTPLLLPVGNSALTIGPSQVSDTIIPAGHTLYVELFLQATGQIGGLTITAKRGPQTVGLGTNWSQLTLDSKDAGSNNLGLRYRYPRSGSVTGVGSTALTRQTRPTAKQATGVGSVAFSRQLALFRAFSVTGVGAAAVAKKIIIGAAKSVTGVGSSALSLQISQTMLNRISGAGAVAKKIIFIFDD